MGSHLVDRLMRDGHEVWLRTTHICDVNNDVVQVTVVDNFFTGRKKNIEHWYVWSNCKHKLFILKYTGNTNWLIEYQLLILKIGWANNTL